MNSKKIINLILCIVICMALGSLSGLFTVNEIKTWYSTINKPSWNPPNFIFAPVWTSLYLLMGISLGIIINKSKSPERTKAIILFIIQFVLNFFWSLIFFKFHHLLFAFIEIILMWFAILLTIISFSKINKIAAWLLVPYIAWVSFASILTYTIWQLN